jgi:hypothetical protein
MDTPQEQHVEHQEIPAVPVNDSAHREAVSWDHVFSSHVQEAVRHAENVMAESEQVATAKHPGSEVVTHDTTTPALQEAGRVSANLDATVQKKVPTPDQERMHVVFHAIKEMSDQSLSELAHLMLAKELHA